MRFLRYLAVRILQLIPVFLGTTFLVYALVFLTPGDPVVAMFGDRAPNPAIVAQIKAQYHLDQPFIVQYLYYLKGIFVGDFGHTLQGNQDIAAMIANAYPVTAALAIMALTFEAVFGIIFGVIAGIKKGGWFDSTLLVASLIILAVPTFVIGYVLRQLVGVELGWLPVTVPSQATFQSLIMPAVVLGAVSFCYVLRLTRVSVSEALSADHVRTATAKGLSRGRVIRVHVLRNSLIPVVTFLGTDLGGLMGGAIVTERVFNIQGVGSLILRGVNLGDNSLTVSVVTVLVVVYLLANLLVDLLYSLLDPRIRHGK
ncbi:ABC transporter permease [Micrococcales bacterium 31B]|nr:ABC transporter permease [Micrococcales bacterium 31B]